jgi:hypothetical protein
MRVQFSLPLDVDLLRKTVLKDKIEPCAEHLCALVGLENFAI